MRLLFLRRAGFTLVELLVAHCHHRPSYLAPAAGRAGRRRRPPGGCMQPTTSSRSGWRCTTTTTRSAAALWQRGHVGHSDYAIAGTLAAMILPYIEQKPLYDLFNFRLPMDDASNTTAVQTLVTEYICPRIRRGATRVDQPAAGFKQPAQSDGNVVLTALRPDAHGSLRLLP